MTEPVQNSGLPNRHYVTLSLRCALDGRGRLISGEMVDTGQSLTERLLGEAGRNEAPIAWPGQQKVREGGEGELPQGL